MNLPMIVVHIKHPNNMLEVCIMGLTKRDGTVRYTYTIPNNFTMQKILSKKFFKFKDWHFIKENGKLTKREICK